MPQVDKIILLPQVFWLVFLFLGFYFYISRSRLKPFLSYIKIKYSFLLMNFIFYFNLFLQVSLYQSKAKLLVLYYEKQLLLFKELDILEEVIHGKRKNNQLQLLKGFFITYINNYLVLDFQYEKAAKNSI